MSSSEEEEIDYSKLDKGKVLFAWKSSMESELSKADANELLWILIPDSGNGWIYGQSIDKSREGYIPSSFIEKIHKRALPVPHHPPSSSHSHASTLSATTTSGAASTSHHSENKTSSKTSTSSTKIETMPAKQQNPTSTTTASTALNTPSSSSSSTSSPSKENDKKSASSAIILRTFRTVHQRKRINAFLKNIRERINSFEEIRNSEKIYVDSLTTMVQLFLIPLRNRADTKKKPQKVKKARQRIDSMFGNIEMILGINQELLNSLNKSSSLQVGETLSKIIPFLRVYLTYIQNYPAASSLFSEKKNKNGAFAQFILEQQKDPKSKGLSLRDYLIMPIQRLPRYELLIAKLLSHTPESTNAWVSLDKVQAEIKKINVLINQTKKHLESAEKVAKMRNKKDTLKGNKAGKGRDITGLLESLVKPYRRYVKEGRLRINMLKREEPIQGKYPATDWFNVFLGDDCLFAWMEDEDDDFKNFTAINFCFAELEDIEEQRIQHTGILGQITLEKSTLNGLNFKLSDLISSYVFTCASQEEKTDWFKELTNCIREQRNYLQQKGVKQVGELFTDYWKRMGTLSSVQNTLNGIHTQYQAAKIMLKEVDADLIAEKAKAKEILSVISKRQLRKKELEQTLEISNSKENEEANAMISTLEAVKKLRTVLIHTYHSDRDEFEKAFGPESQISEAESFVQAILRGKLDMAGLKKDIGATKKLRSIEYKRSRSSTLDKSASISVASSSSAPDEGIEHIHADEETEDLTNQLSQVAISEPLVLTSTGSSSSSSSSSSSTASSRRPSLLSSVGSFIVPNISPSNSAHNSVALSGGIFPVSSSVDPDIQFLEDRYHTLRISNQMSLEREKNLQKERSELIRKLQEASETNLILLQEKEEALHVKTLEKIEKEISSWQESKKEAEEATEKIKAHYESLLKEKEESSKMMVQSFEKKLEEMQKKLENLSLNNNNATKPSEQSPSEKPDMTIDFQAQVELLKKENLELRKQVVLNRDSEFMAEFYRKQAETLKKANEKSWQVTKDLTTEIDVLRQLIQTSDERLIELHKKNLEQGNESARIFGDLAVLRTKSDDVEVKLASAEKYHQHQIHLLKVQQQNDINQLQQQHENEVQARIVAALNNNNTTTPNFSPGTSVEKESSSVSRNSIFSLNLFNVNKNNSSNTTTGSPPDTIISPRGEKEAERKKSLLKK